MRISDWSSDVCSSDLDRRGHGGVVALHRVDGAGLQGAEQLRCRHKLVGVVELDLHLAVGRPVEGFDLRLDDVSAEGRAGIGLQAPLDGSALRLHVGRRRSEEHTSELQSLMRISYAVFCWKK